jgi:hypothetical protein
MGKEIDLEQFRASGFRPPKKPTRKKTKQANPFIRGPIPLVWLTSASNIPRRNALVVGLVLWYLAGLRSDRVGLVLCIKRCEPFGLGRKSVERGLRDLEKSGLVRVERGSGKCPRVELLDVEQS